MEYTTLGRTGLRVSIAGLGCGGPSAAGKRTGQSEAHSVSVIRRAIDSGITFFDTARSYRTEAILGKALQSVAREAVVISTKHSARGVSPDGIVEALHNALRALQTDYLDIFHLHGVHRDDYDHAVNHLVPALLRERERGKFRFLGITETTSADTQHVTLSQALEDECWDVMMIAFNMMHQSALSHVLPTALERSVGTLIMSAARNLASTPEKLLAAIRGLVAEGALPLELGTTDEPLGFLLHEAGATSLMDATYRYARHASGADVILFGTGNPSHIDANIASLLRPPLPPADMARIADLFGRLEGIGLKKQWSKTPTA